MEITLSDGQTVGQTGDVATGAQLALWIDQLARGRGTSLILAKDPATWMQAMADDGGYRVEKCAGSDDAHYAAVAKAAPIAGQRSSAEHLSLDEVQLLLEDFLKGRASPSFVSWRKLRSAPPPLNPWVRAYRAGLIIVIFALFMLCAIWIIDGFPFG